MLQLKHMVNTMANQRFVQPVEKGLESDHGLVVDIASVVIAGEEKDKVKSLCSWWSPLLNLPVDSVHVFESLDEVDSELCDQVMLLKCTDRCCMNWSLYDQTSCINSSSTKCDRLHQLSLCNQTLNELGKVMRIMTEWDIHFIMCESISSIHKVPMHLNRLDSLADFDSVLVLNPNNFPITILLQEKVVLKAPVRHKKKGKRTSCKTTGSCQMSIKVSPRKVICLTKQTVLYWKVYAASLVANYMVCVMGRYDTRNWLVNNILDGKKLQTYKHVQ